MRRLLLALVVAASCVAASSAVGAQQPAEKYTHQQSFTSRLGDGEVEWNCTRGHFDGRVTFSRLPTTELPIGQVQAAHYAYLLASPGKDAGSAWLPQTRGAATNGGYQSFTTPDVWLGPGDPALWSFVGPTTGSFTGCDVQVSFYLMDPFADSHTIDYGNGVMGPAVPQEKAVEIPLQASGIPKD